MTVTLYLTRVLGYGLSLSVRADMDSGGFMTKRWLLRKDGIRQRYNMKASPVTKGLHYDRHARAWARAPEEKAEIYEGETETAPSDPTDWEGEVEYEPYI